MDAWSKFLGDVEKATEKCGDMPFFRGHTNSKWKLLPSLFRKKFYKINECSMYYDFLSYSGPLYESDRPSSWQVLFDMRHCGMLTRLLDWTENLAVALYFAIRGRVLQRPAIWILDPFGLLGTSTEWRDVKQHVLASIEFLSSSLKDNVATLS